jgi:hypothetical protein
LPRASTYLPRAGLFCALTSLFRGPVLREVFSIGLPNAFMRDAGSKKLGRKLINLSGRALMASGVIGAPGS